MGALKGSLYYLFHPYQLRAIIQWKVWHEPVHQRDPTKESETLRECFKYLDLTSRSFAAVIQELNPELLVPITLFYLVLRGLDTIEDDMTIKIKEKEPLLRNFHENMEVDGWTFDKNGPNEKDRELLVHFDVVVTELKKIKKPYYDIIKDIATKMGNGMADYALNAEFNANGVETTAEYEKYCHYVAGLVGEGLTLLFVEAKLANPHLLNRMDLTESMGQFLQKTNIIRDIREDYDDGRRFYPKEIWSKHVDKWEDMFDPAHRKAAVSCISEMILNALRNVPDCLFYMAAIRDQSIFNFVAIPQAMAIATLELVFNNPDVLERNVKITKGDACQLMLDSTQNLRVLCDTFRRYARRIHKKNDPRDPSYVDISIACGKIEQFIDTIFPPPKPKTKEDVVAEQTLMQKRRDETPTMTVMEAVWLFLAIILVLFLLGALMLGTAWLLGGQFDKLYKDPKHLPGLDYKTPTPKVGHDEL